MEKCGSNAEDLSCTRRVERLVIGDARSILLKWHNPPGALLPHVSWENRSCELYGVSWHVALSTRDTRAVILSMILRYTPHTGWSVNSDLGVVDEVKVPPKPIANRSPAAMMANHTAAVL